MTKYVFNLLIAALVFSNLYSQDSLPAAPYKRFPTYPPIRLLKLDSTSYFSKEDVPKKTPVMLMLFNPQCEHCQHETEQILQHIDQFKKISIVMATSMSFDSMKAFAKKYELEKYPNIIVGQDIHYFLPTFFRIRSLPFLAFYNKKKELISVFEGAMPIPQLMAVFD